jgi:hypothetical protein
MQDVSYILEPLMGGSYNISFLNIPFLPKQEGAAPKDIFSEVFRIEVKLPAVEEHKIAAAPLLPLSLRVEPEISYENRANILNNPALLAQEAERNVRVFRQRTFPWFGVLFTLALVGLSLALWKPAQYFIKRVRESMKKPETPQDKALRALQALKSFDLSKNEKVEEFYVRLTDIVRIYIEEFFHIEAQEESTEEFLHAAKTYKFFDEKTQKNLTNFLTQADLVKFAKYVPTQKERLNALQAAEQFIWYSYIKRPQKEVETVPTSTG